MPKVSIIIPCYNHGKYIMDAISSVEKIEDKNLYELIIINDGSTDEYTNTLLKELSDKGYYVIFQENKGLATSRNNAIAISKGEYILPLDADNKIRPEYIYKGINIYQ
jgi:glycosyltransferase involved in cell wall biosynthesis